MRFSDFVGEIIVLLVPRFNGNNVLYARLMDVEENGIWVESQTVTNAILQALPTSTDPEQLVVLFWGACRASRFGSLCHPPYFRGT